MQHEVLTINRNRIPEFVWIMVCLCVSKESAISQSAAAGHNPHKSQPFVMCKPRNHRCLAASYDNHFRSSDDPDRRKDGNFLAVLGSVQGSSSVLPCLHVYLNSKDSSCSDFKSTFAGELLGELSLIKGQRGQPVQLVCNQNCRVIGL